MYTAAAINQLYAQQGRASANDYADMSRQDFANDAALMKHFNTEFAGGKWNHFQDDVHIGYTTWSEPNQPSFNQIRLASVTPGDAPALGVAVENSAAAWPGGGAANELSLPKFNAIAQQKRFIDVFNRGAGSIEFTATPSNPWIVLSSTKGATEKDARLWVSIDWAKVPSGPATGSVKITQGGTDASVNVEVSAISASDVTHDSLTGFVEDDGIVSIEPEHFTKQTDAGDLKWIKVEDYGRTLSAMRGQGPVDFAAITPKEGTPCLEYKIYFLTAGNAQLEAILAPNLSFIPGRDLHYAVSIDGQAPVMVNAIPKGSTSDSRDWNANTQNEARKVTSPIQIPSAGYHTLKIWMVDPGITLRKLVISLGNLKPSYLGPPETYHK